MCLLSGTDRCDENCGNRRCVLAFRSLSGACQFFHELPHLALGLIGLRGLFLAGQINGTTRRRQYVLGLPDNDGEIGAGVDSPEAFRT
jgi:hypothetical protein